jgi:hypothetical protein
MNTPNSLTGLPTGNCEIVGNGSVGLSEVLGGLLFLRSRVATVIHWGNGTMSAAEAKRTWAFATILLHQTAVAVGGGAIAPRIGNFEERVARAVKRLYPPRKLAADEAAFLVRSLDEAIGEGQHLLPATITSTNTIHSTLYEYNHVLAQCR